MSSSNTPGEDRAHQLDRERYDEEQSRRNRAQWLRICPTGYVVDVDHLAGMLGQGWGSNKPYLVARYFVIRGMRAAGYDAAFIARALSITPERVGEEEARSIYSQEMLDSIAKLNAEEQSAPVVPSDTNARRVAL